MAIYAMAKLSLLRRARQFHQFVFSQSSSRFEVESSVFTTPGDVSPVAEYDVGRLYWTCMLT